MSLGSLHSRVSDAISRGTTWDAKLIPYVRDAARWIERNYTFEYMKRLGTFVINAGAAEPRLLDLPQRIKSVAFIRLVKDLTGSTDKEYKRLRKLANPEDIERLETLEPSRYWVNKGSEFWLAEKPDQNYNAEIRFVQYTLWPTDLDGTTWLIDNAEDLVLAQTMMMMAAPLRDPDLIQLWKNTRDEALRGLEISDEDFEYDNTSESMNYGTYDP